MAISTNQLNCLQINLQHSKLATVSLSQTILELQIDICLIQEPYAIGSNASPVPSIPDTPDGYTCFHRLGSHRNSFLYGTAIIAKTSLKAQLLTDISCNEITAIAIPHAESEITFLSIYVRPSITTPLSLNQFLSPILNPSLPFKRSLKKSYIAIDANARNKLWNSKTNDSRGIELELLLHRLPLNVANHPLSQLSHTPHHSNFVDLTLHGDSPLPELALSRYTQPIRSLIYNILVSPLTKHCAGTEKEIIMRLSTTSRTNKYIDVPNSAEINSASRNQHI